ncbi:MAG: glucose-6-phosphate dehydrogenase assembly protein OpcA [Chloroflexi bacterium]|nr:glucose-6-phosphate dehydrogenase assembly protein OpcA [Chloroflexota bacterium]
MDAASPLLDLTPRSLAWSARATSVADIERALARIWAAAPDAAVGPDGERHVVARTSVLNFVAVAGSEEVATRVLAAVGSLTSRHPSRTIVVEPRDAEGPRRIEAEVTATCALARGAGAAVCTETIRLRAGGDAGRHLASILPPLLVHDLPVTLWWPEDVPFHRPDFVALLMHAIQADRLVVDGSTWRGDGLAGLRGLVGAQAASGIAISDFALMRQSRWRDAIASAFDLPDLLPYLGSIRGVTVEYTASRADPAGTNVVRPLYHAAWIGSRLGWSATEPLRVEPDGRRRATLRRPRGHVELSLVPVASDLPGGATTRVRIAATRRRSRLDVEVTARPEAVVVRARLDDGEPSVRLHHAARRTDADLLAEAVESGGRDPLTTAAIRLAGALAERGAEAGT